MKSLHHAGVDLLIREGSSDGKCFKEVIVDHVYAKGFTGNKLRFEPAPGETWLDLGANIGAFTAWAGKRGARVIAYEPEQACFDLLKQNVELNRLNVEAHQAAVIAGDETKLTLSLGEQGSEWRNSLIKTKSLHTQEVDFINFDKVLTPAVDGVKMDIEGAEIEILQQPRDWGNVSKLCFEWSFDVDDRLSTFWSAVKQLRKHFRFISYPNQLRRLEHYPYFPPAVIVYCLR